MKAFVILLLAGCCLTAFAQEPWEAATYPDKEGLQHRLEGQVEAIASRIFGEKSKAPSRCPDTGLPVRTWALEGETVYSPYTGRAYIQGPVGYFGPVARDTAGRILAFGGDPLKKDLPPALASLLLDTGHLKARHYLSIPGNLRQQYHFACKNWCRFYPMLGEVMGEAWNLEFRRWVAAYTESRRPSDGYREHAPLATPHNLVGEPGELLGGNMKDGGTENHKTMWRTSALLYSQLFPGGSMISGRPKEEVEELVTGMLNDYLRKCLTVGNGEYDSEIYYPHSMEAFMNLYDFSPDPETRLMAKTALDFYLASSGLKMVGGALAGGQKRGSLPAGKPSSLEDFAALWNRDNSRDMTMPERELSIHSATTGYRPNRIVTRIMEKEVPLPFQATMSRPLYHMNECNAFQEYFWCSHSYGIGSVYMTMVDNPNQQIVWSLVARGRSGPLLFGGLQPFHRHLSGYTPYSQTLQHRGNLVVVTGPTEDPAGNSREEIQRTTHAGYSLLPVEVPQEEELEDPGAIRQFFEASKTAAATWFFIPKQVDTCYSRKGRWFIQANTTLICVTPLTSQVDLIALDERVAGELREGRTRPGILKNYDILVIRGPYSGFALECGELPEHGSLEEFEQQVITGSRLNLDSFSGEGSLTWECLDGSRMTFDYQEQRLRCRGTVNGEELDYENWNDGFVYRSPCLTIGEGRMWLYDGEEGYMVDYRGSAPVYRTIRAMPE